MRFALGGYTSADGGGLGLVSLDHGRLGAPVLVAEAANPSYLVWSADRRVVYAVLEGDEGRVGAWWVGDESGADGGPWTARGERETGGSAPCHLAVSPDGRFVVCANYGSGSVSVHPVGSDGSVGERTDLAQHSGVVGPVAGRQDGPHAHQVVFAPTGELLSCDLGLDAVIAYDLDGQGRLAEIARSALAAGTGPRHLAFAPDGQTAWVVGELASTLTVCRVVGPTLVPLASLSTRAPEAAGENLAAEILVSADGKSVLVSNRGDDTVTWFDVDGQSLTPRRTIACGGHWPRLIAFGEDESTVLVTNERSGTVTVLGQTPGGWQVTDSARWPAATAVAALG